jgi:regulator of protease activity HflC (stomatin/prohibitin superfamily)
VFWFSIICFIVAVLAFGAIFFSREKFPAVMTAFIAAVVGAASLTIASYNKVPTRNVGIVTQFGKPTGKTTGAGLHWTKPWQNVEDWDATGQVYDRLGDNCLWVSISAQRRACIAVQVEWSANPASAPELWAQYKVTDQGKKIDSDQPRFGTFIYRRVNPQIDGVITSVFSSFDPLGAVSATGDAPAPDLNKTYRTTLQAAIQQALGTDITIKSIAFATPTYDAPTTAAIAAYGQKMLEARNLKVDQQNAAARNAVAAKTGVSPAVQQCLDIADSRSKEPGLCMGGSVALTKPVG